MDHFDFLHICYSFAASFNLALDNQFILQVLHKLSNLENQKKHLSKNSREAANEQEMSGNWVPRKLKWAAKILAIDYILWHCLCNTVEYLCKLVQLYLGSGNNLYKNYCYHNIVTLKYLKCHFSSMTETTDAVVLTRFNFVTCCLGLYVSFIFYRSETKLNRVIHS